MTCRWLRHRPPRRPLCAGGNGTIIAQALSVSSPRPTTRHHQRTVMKDPQDAPLEVLDQFFQFIMSPVAGLRARREPSGLLVHEAAEEFCASAVEPFQFSEFLERGNRPPP
ncbi:MULTISPECIES: hypothetical protein [Actinosynnema]|uniref:hypothetical protein n=1 Tax=Actinosynnema TaxID=40566 RepID=UPI0020A50476|nr:hypothetical protein [Actinosynnema pretiosum]